MLRQTRAVGPGGLLPAPVRHPLDLESPILTRPLALLTAVGVAGCTVACGVDRVSAPAVVPGGAPLRATAAATTTRPLGEFLAANAACSYSYFREDDPAGVLVVADVWGSYQANAPDRLAASRFDGTVAVRPLADGRAEVTAAVHGHDVLVYAFDRAVPPRALLFGSNYFAVVNGAPPTLGDSYFRVTFRIASPDAALPSLCAVAPEDWLSNQTTVTARGPLHTAFGVAEGTPGMLHVTDVGRYATPGKGIPAGDGIPVTVITIRPVGN